MKTLKSIFAGAALMAASAMAFATPVSLNGEAPDLQAIINSLYDNAGTPLSQAPDVNLNQANEDGRFAIEASGVSNAVMIIEVAANSGNNTFGIYDINNPNVFLQLFAGSAGATDFVTLSVNDTNQFTANGQTVQFSSSTFGYYLGSANGPLFYSQAGLNDGDDHLVVFQGDGDTIKLPGKPTGIWGASSLILAWEDQPLATGDTDYQDLVVYVESVSIVPEPATVALFGLGLLGFAAARRRSNKA